MLKKAVDISWYKNPAYMVPIIAALISAPWWPAIFEGNKSFLANLTNQELPKPIDTPAQKYDDIEVTSNAISRNDNGLRIVEPLETDKSVELLKNNVYGYTYGHKITPYINEDRELHLSIRKDQYHFEIQKYNNTVYVAGFVDESTFFKIGAEENEMELTLFSVNWNNNLKLILVPTVSIKDIDDGEIEIDESQSISKLDIKINGSIVTNNHQIFRNDWTANQ